MRVRATGITVVNDGKEHPRGSISTGCLARDIEYVFTWDLLYFDIVKWTSSFCPLFYPFDHSFRRFRMLFDGAATNGAFMRRLQVIASIDDPAD